MNKSNLVLTPEEVKELGSLIAWSMNGAEHGVITHDQWKTEVYKLIEFCKKHGIPVYGQWTTI